LPGLLLLLASRSPRNHPASTAIVSKGRMASHWFHGIQVEPWIGMSQLLPLWQIPTSQLPLLQQQQEARYADLPASFSFQPIAVKTLGPINDSAIDFLRELGRMISAKVQDERHIAFLFPEAVGHGSKF